MNKNSTQFVQGREILELYWKHIPGYENRIKCTGGTGDHFETMTHIVTEHTRQAEVSRGASKMPLGKEGMRLTIHQPGTHNQKQPAW